MSVVATASVNILFTYLTYFYLERFESLNCECAYDVRKDICKSFLLIFYVLIAGKLMYPDIPNSARFFMMGFSLLFEIVFASYIYSIKNKRCNCQNLSQGFATSVLYYYYMLIFFIIVIFISMIILLVPMNLFISK